MADVIGIAVGSFYIISSIVLLFTYLVSMFAIWLDAELRHLSCYRMILAVGFTDIVQIIFLGTAAGIASVAGSDGSTFAFKIMGAVVICCWYGTSALGLLLSFNRFVICWSKSTSDMLFGGKKTFAWIGLCYAYLLAMFIFYCCPGVDLLYSSNSHLWYYNMSLPLTVVAATVNEGNDIVTISLMTVFHIGIFVMLKMKRLATTNSKLSKNERRAIAPAFIISLTMAVLCTYYFVAQAVTSDRWTLIGIELTWLYTAGLNGILFVVFNTTIKNQVRKLFGFTHDHHSTTQVHPAQPSRFVAPADSRSQINSSGRDQNVPVQA